MGYKYNMLKVLSFIFTKDAGSLAPGDPYVLLGFPTSLEM
jgi:hypothetical protein